MMSRILIGGKGDDMAEVLNLEAGILKEISVLKRFLKRQC